jgi:integrase
MTGRPVPAPLVSASFRNDEPVFGDGHQVRDGFTSPLFGDVGRWSGECIGRPANRQPADWEVAFPEEDALVNLQLRETAFAWLNPTHAVLRRAGVFLAAEPMGFGTVKAHCLKLQALARRGRELGLGQGLGAWDKEDWKLIVADQGAELDASTVATYVNGVRALRRVAAVVSGIDPFDDPWDGLAAAKVALQERPDETAETNGLSTPDIPPGTWWALLRAAWTYIHALAPDILSWREDFERRAAALPEPKPRAERVDSLTPADLDALLNAWLADPGHVVPLLAKEWQGSPAGTPIWKTLSRIITNGRNQDLFSARKGRLSKRVAARRTAVLKAVGEGHCVTAHGPTASRTLGAPAYQPHRPRPVSKAQLDEDVRRWLADPDNRIPVRAVDDLHGKAGTPIWATLARQIWGPRDAARSHPCLKRNRSRSALIMQAVQAGQVVLVDSTERSRAGWRSLPMPCPHATTVTRSDGSSGPWRTKITQGELDDELRMLRAACYIFIAALSMMRDSEVQEIERDPLVTYFGSPAITSRKTKLDPARPELFWWIFEPVAEAVAVAEALSWHPTHLFATLEPPRQGTRPRRSDGRPRKIGRNGITPADEIDFFIERINTTCSRLGLEEIPAAHVRPHMFRKTMAAIAAREPDSEIAVGLQLKHAARRAMANRTSQAYGKMDPEWAKEFDRELEHAAALKLVGLLRARRDGESVAVGPGAARLHAGLDKVIETMNGDPQLRAQIADERVEAALLASEFPELHFGTINHCMFDAPQAECQDQLPEDQRGQAPLLGACEPARCRNSVVTRSHAPIWISEEDDLMAMVKNRRLAPPRREAVLIRLADVQGITDALKDEMGDNL